MKRHSQDQAAPLLTIDNLSIDFPGRGATAHALDGVSLCIQPGEIFGMVGETGAGKSLTAWSALGLLPEGAVRRSGSIIFDGKDVWSMLVSEQARVRGNQMAIVVQNPKAALSPTSRVGHQLANAYRAHAGGGRKHAWQRAVESLREVGIADPERRARGYPHELSIGMAQRVLIALTLLHTPKLVIADEPTSGLDVTVQAQVLDLLLTRVQEYGTALWLITHDLGVIANYCDRVAVMFAGQVVEQASTSALFRRPAHPYVRGLLQSRLGERPERRLSIAGLPPDLTYDGRGCRFAYRCPWVEQRCRETAPSLKAVAGEQATRCWVAQDVAAGKRSEPGEGEPMVAEVRR